MMNLKMSQALYPVVSQSPVKRASVIFASFLLLFCSATNSHAVGSGGVNALERQNDPYLIVVSIDGFRWDYADQHNTPTLDRLAAEGIRARSMRPVYPTLTFPNHYSIATGLYPANHGLIGNKFPAADHQSFYSLKDRESVQNGSWYGGEPIWVAAEKAGLVTAAYYFVGTEAAVQGVPMTYWNVYDAGVPGDERVQQVLDWLSMSDEQRPHLVTLYFEDVDTATHYYGPDSAQGTAAIEKVDGYLATLVDGIANLPIAEEVYLVVVSDHGQAQTLDEPPFILDSVSELNDLVVIDHGAATFLFFPQPEPQRARLIRDEINQSWGHGEAILLEDAPAEWRLSGNANLPDLIVQADPGYLVFSTAAKAGHSSVGDHGWVPDFADMHGIFYARGPSLPAGLEIPEISVVDVYPLMMNILNLPITTPIDGDKNRLPALMSP